MAVPVAKTGVWIHRAAFEDAEAQYLATGKTVKLTIGGFGVSPSAGFILYTRLCISTWTSLPMFAVAASEKRHCISRRFNFQMSVVGNHVRHEAASFFLVSNFRRFGII